MCPTLVCPQAPAPSGPQPDLALLAQKRQICLESMCGLHKTNASVQWSWHRQGWHNASCGESPSPQLGFPKLGSSQGVTAGPLPLSSRKMVTSSGATHSHKAPRGQPMRQEPTGWEQWAGSSTGGAGGWSGLQFWGHCRMSYLT